MASLLRVPVLSLARRVTMVTYGTYSRSTSLLRRNGSLGLLGTKRNYGREAGDAISSCSQHGDGVVLGWGATSRQSEPWSKYHFFWLRDNCMCPQCYHPGTNQRLIDTLAVPLDLKPRRVEVTKKAKVLRVEWDDGHASEYDAEWLIKNSYESEGLEDVRVRPATTDEMVLWGKEIAGTPPEVEYSKVMQGDQELLECLKKIKKYGFCFINGTPPTGSETKKLIETMFGVLRTTFYGSFWDYAPNIASSTPTTTSDTAFTNLAIAAHTDGNYFSEAPGIEVFHIVRFEGTGGQSALVDGFKVAEEIRKKSPDHFKVLSTVPFSYHFTDDELRLVNSNLTVVLDDRSGQVKSVHFNDADRLPLNSVQVELLQQQEFGGNGSPMQQLYEAIRAFARTSRDESLVYRFMLEPGKLLIFNNHRLLHARAAFTGVRVMCGCYVNMEDYDSKLTVLKEKYE